MKISLALVLMSAGIASPAFAHVDGVRFVPVKSFSEDSQLPPNLNVVFDLQCNELLQKVIREEIPDTNGRVVIAVGGLVVDNGADCTGAAHEVKASAGKTFSGRAYLVLPITR